MVCRLASGPSCPGFDSQRSQKISEEKLPMLQRLNNGAAKSKVDSGLKMLFEPTYFWPVASPYYKIRVVDCLVCRSCMCSECTTNLDEVTNGQKS